MLAKPVRVTADALSRVLTAQQLGTPHPVIETEPVFTDTNTDRRAELAMWTEFRTLGLADHRNRLDPDMMDTLAVLGRPAVELFGWFTDRGLSFGVLVAGLGTEAVTAVRIGARVHLASHRNQGLSRELVRHLPTATAAKIGAVTLRVPQRPPPLDDSGVLIAATDPHQTKELASIRALVAQPATGYGELYVAARNRCGVRVVDPTPLRFRDTAQGSVLIAESNGFVSIAPASGKQLIERLDDALARLTLVRT